MTAAPRPVAPVVERLVEHAVVAVWRVVDAAAAATVLVVEVRRCGLRGARRRSGATGPTGATATGAGTVAAARPVPRPPVAVPARALDGSLTA